MSLNIREAKQAIKINMRSDITTLLRSDPGMGKSELVDNTICPWLLSLPENESLSIGLSTLFMATQSPIGWTGLPWKGEKVWIDPLSGKEFKYTVTDPALPQWFMAKDLRTGEVRPASMFHKVLFIAEEWGQGGPDAKKAGAEVLRALGTPPFYLPVGSWAIAMSNTSVRDGVNKEFDFILNRVQVLDMHGDTKIWVEDFADKPYIHRGRKWEVTPFSKTYALQPGNENNVCEAKPEVQGPWCTFRSYTAADRIVQSAAVENGGVVPIDSSLLVQQLTGTMGSRTTTHYIGQLRFAIKLPSYDKVVADPTGVDIPKQMDLQMCMAFEMAARTQPQDLPAVLTFINRLASGMDNVYIGTVFRKNYASFSSHPAMIAWTSKNAARMSLISSLAAGL